MEKKEKNNKKRRKKERFIKEKRFLGGMDVYTAAISDDIITALVKKIKEKKEFKTVDDSFCIEKIRQFLLLNKKMREKCALAKKQGDIKRGADVRALVKDIRASLRSSYGLFQRADVETAQQIFERHAKTGESVERILPTLLELHASTKERLPHYKQFFSDIFVVVGKTESILDIGCGFNPLAFPWMGQTPKTYAAVELYEKDVAFIRNYFKKTIRQTKCEAHTVDLEKKEQRSVLYRKKYDVTLALKLFDLLKKKTVEELVKNIRCRWLVASFSTTTITGKRMNVPRRGWFQKMLRRLEYSFTTLTYENELVYLIKKENKKYQPTTHHLLPTTHSP